MTINTPFIVLRKPVMGFIHLLAYGFAVAFLKGVAHIEHALFFFDNEFGTEIIQGFDAVFAGNVPLGAGLSSSAALESCFAFALNDLFNGNTIDKFELAKIGQSTEHNYCGVNCGIMDQFYTSGRCIKCAVLSEFFFENPFDFFVHTGCDN